MQTILIRRDKADAVRNSYAREGKKQEKKTKKMSSSLAFDVFGKHWTTKALHFENYCLNFLHAILPILGQKIEIVDAKTRQVLGGLAVDNVTVQYKPLQLSITLYHNPQDYKLSIQDTREYRKKWKRVIAKGQTFPQNLQEEIQLFCSVSCEKRTLFWYLISLRLPFFPHPTTIKEFTFCGEGELLGVRKPVTRFC